MEQINKAVQYIRNNPRISFHAVAVDFNVDVQKLMEEYAKAYNAGKR